jgi:hypothetical protein
MQLRFVHELALVGVHRSENLGSRLKQTLAVHTSKNATSADALTEYPSINL